MLNHTPSRLYSDMSHGTSNSRLVAHFMSRGIPRLVVPRVSYSTPRLVVRSCSTPRESRDFHGRFFDFTREYLRVTTRGLPRESEVVVERYRSR